MSVNTEDVNISQMADMEKYFDARVFSLTYVHLARAVIDKFGREGEKMIRKGLRAYGKYRGQRLREWHLKEGLPINLESSFHFWDISLARPEVGALHRSEKSGPYYEEHECPLCPVHQACKEANFERDGYIYCDEVHQEILMAYDPSCIVEIHESLMKGDDSCIFRCRMNANIPEEQIDRSAYQTLKSQISEKSVEYTLYYLERDVTLVALLYYFLADAIISRFGDDGKVVVEQALRELGRQRGRELREKFEKTNETFAWTSLFNNFDMPYSYVWDVEPIEVSNNQLVAEVRHCPLAKAWNELGDKHLGPLYCATMYEEMLKALDKRAEIHISETLAGGVQKCHFEFRSRAK